MEILNELYQFGFILSIIFIIFVVISFIAKLVGRFKFDNETKFTMGNVEKSILLVAISYILTYLF